MAQWNDEWGTDAWRDEASQWIAEVLDAYGLQATGTPEYQRPRLWSARIVVATDHGKLHFKAVNPGQLAEVSVTSVAAHLAPEQLVLPLATDPVRGWMISPDYGHTLAEIPSTDHRIWERIVRDFARLQQELVPFGDTLFDAGLLQLDPAWLPNHIEEQVLLHASIPPEHPLHLPARDAEELQGRLGELRAMCGYLAEGPIPLTLDHNDLHRANAFVPGGPDEALRFLDLGDAYWAHPFSSLAVPLLVMCEELQADPSDPRIRRVTTVYLEQWRDWGTVEELRPYLEPALRIGKMQSHDTWMRMLNGASDAELERYAHRALRPLSELPRPIPL